MTFKIIKGDLFDPAHGFSTLAQGTNCRGVMGAGIAVPFRKYFPLMFGEYKKLCAAHHAILPGTIQFSSADGNRHYDTTGKTDMPDIANLFTQYHPGANADYALVEKALYNLDNFLTTFVGNATYISDIDYDQAIELVHVGLPLIGCGIGGLERHNVIPLMEHYFGSSPIQYTLVER